MKSLHKSRRHFAVSAVVVAAALPNIARTQTAAPGQPLRLAPRSTGRLHNESLNQSREALRGKTAIESDGLKLLIDELTRLKVVPTDAADSLKKLVDNLTQSKSIAALFEEAEKFLNSLPGAFDEVVTAVADIARSSADFIRSQLKDVSIQQAIVIVSSDLAGALTGAATGSKLGQYGAVVGAAIGASSASINAAFAKR